MRKEYPMAEIDELRQFVKDLKQLSACLSTKCIEQQQRIDELTAECERLRQEARR